MKINYLMKMGISLACGAFLMPMVAFSDSIDYVPYGDKHSASPHHESDYPTTTNSDQISNKPTQPGYPTKPSKPILPPPQ